MGSNREMTEIEENNNTDRKKLRSEMKKIIEEAVKRDLKTENTSKTSKNVNWFKNCPITDPTLTNYNLILPWAI